MTRNTFYTILLILTSVLAVNFVYQLIHTEKELSLLKTQILKQQEIINEKTFHIEALNSHLEALSATNDSLQILIDTQKEKVVYIKEKEQIIKSQVKSDQDLIISIQSHTK